MSGRIVAMSNIYQHGKTQIPAKIRKFLGIADGDNINYVQAGSRLFITKGENLKVIENNKGKYR